MPGENEPFAFWRVRVAKVAEDDLDEIIDYFIQIDELDVAAEIMDDFTLARKSLETLPLRAHYTNELKELVIYSHREIHFRVYRIIFRVHEELREVHVDAILDGRRNILQILANRLLRSPGEDEVPDQYKGI